MRRLTILAILAWALTGVSLSSLAVAKQRVGVAVVKKSGKFRGNVVDDLLEIMIATVTAKGRYEIVPASQVVSRLGRNANTCIETTACLKGAAMGASLDFVVVAQLSKRGNEWTLAVRRAFSGAFATQQLSYQIVGSLPALLKGLQEATNKLLDQPAVLPKPKDQIQTIYLQIVQEGAEIFLNHKLVGRSPLPKLTLPKPGKCHIEVRKEGFVPFTGIFQCEQGRTFVITLAKKAPVVVQPKKVDRYRERMSAYRLAAWITLGTGVALVATGGALFGVAYKQNHSLNDKCSGTTTIAGTPICDTTQTDAHNSVSSINTKLRAGLALTIIGGASLAASVALFFLKSTYRERIIESRWRLTPTIGETYGVNAEVKF